MSAARVREFRNLAELQKGQSMVSVAPKPVDTTKMSDGTCIGISKSEELPQQMV